MVFRYLNTLLQIGSAGDVAFQGRDMGIEPQYGAGPENLSAQGRAMAHREATEAAGGGELGISSAGSGNGRCGI